MQLSAATSLCNIVNHADHCLDGAAPTLSIVRPRRLLMGVLAFLRLCGLHSGSRWYAAESAGGKAFRLDSEGVVEAGAVVFPRDATGQLDELAVREVLR